MVTCLHHYALLLRSLRADATARRDGVLLRTQVVGRERPGALPRERQPCAATPLTTVAAAASGRARAAHTTRSEARAPRGLLTRGSEGD